MDTDEQNKKRKGEVCPFAPHVATNQRSIWCIRDWCKMWDAKKQDCGLKK